MSFREKMKVGTSKAEVDLRLALQTRGLAYGCFSDMKIILEETVPDLYWPSRGLAVYLDAEQTHSGETARLRDDRIDDQLRKLGIKCLRFRYRAPLTKKRLDEIVKSIKEELEKR